MTFTKEKGDRLIAILLASWGSCVVVGLMISALSERRALDVFIVMFAIVVAGVIAAYLFKRDLLSALLLVGGGLIAFAITVVLANLLGL